MKRILLMALAAVFTTGAFAQTQTAQPNSKPTVVQQAKPAGDKTNKGERKHRKHHGKKHHQKKEQK